MWVWGGGGGGLERVGGGGGRGGGEWGLCGGGGGWGVCGEVGKIASKPSWDFKESRGNRWIDLIHPP